MYTLYTDKQKVFECKIAIQGARLNESKVRLVLESSDMNLLFYGEIKSDGSCSIPIRKLSPFLSETTTGKIKLEVIAEDTVFEPWHDTYEIKTSKKVTTEVINSESNIKTDKKITISILREDEEKHLKLITDRFIQIINSSKSNNFTKEKIYALLESKLSKIKLSKNIKQKLTDQIFKQVSKK